MRKGRFFKVSVKKEDEGVAEVVGAILLFAVLITLFTSFMVWYIPAQSTTNETHYEVENKAAISTLVSDLHTSSNTAGSTVSATIPLGISGVSIFSQARDTQFSILPQNNSFNASLSVSLLLNLTGTAGNVSHYVNLSYRITGIMATYANMEYITAIDYVVEDGALLQVYSDNQPANNLGPLPLGVSGNSGSYGISLSAIGLAGFSETYSSTDSQVVNLIVNSSTDYSIQNGSSFALSGTSYTVNSMSLHSLNYTLNGTLSDAWNYAFHSLYNNSLTPYSSVISQTSWKFTGSPFLATASGTLFSISFTGVMQLSSFNSQYVVYEGS